MKMTRIYAINKSTRERTEITDMYWFEENYVHSLTDDDTWEFDIETDWEAYKDEAD